MSARIDMVFISLLIKGETRDWQSLGVAAEMIESDLRPVYTFCVNHWKKENKWPEKGTIKSHFAFFIFYKADEPISYYAKELKTRFKAAKLREALGDITEAFNKGDMELAVNTAIEQTRVLAQYTGDIKVMEYTQSLKEAIVDPKSRYKCKAEYSFGSSTLDRDLTGMERGDWAVIAGLPKRGKTWLLLKLIFNMWLEGMNVLLISLELNSKIITRRLDSLIAKVDYDKYRCGELTEAQERYFLNRIKFLQRAGGKLHVVSAENHDFNREDKFGSVESIYNYARRFKPDFIAVDGIYIGMNLKWEEATKFTNDFHLMLQQLQIPAYSTTQLKQMSDPANPKFSDLSFSAGFGQACDFLFLLAGDENMKKDHQSVLKVGLARETVDGQSYVVELNPGSKVEISPVELQVKNHLAEEDKPSAEQKGGGD